jgi:glutathione S-transferase
MLEDKLFFYNIRERWIDNYSIMRDYSMAKVPFPQRDISGDLIYRATVQKLYDQGTGRFSENEIRASRREVWKGVNAFLEESQKSVKLDECFWVLGGDKPTEADATVYGFIVSTLVADSGPESKHLVRSECPAAVEYAARIHRRYFPEYEMWD